MVRWQKHQRFVAFGRLHNLPVLTIEDMVAYRNQFDLKLGIKIQSTLKSRVFERLFLIDSLYV
ncbi:3,4-dihydroxy-2-butanone 4-phosphate synthase domain protein [Vibrio parahaemolyticus 10290]|nr:3,4-dihydroxy-2-butanone 4-phosphate synthase domain protein [Vibrio parahaemolyticus 10290]